MPAQPRALPQILIGTEPAFLLVDDDQELVDPQPPLTPTWGLMYDRDDGPLQPIKSFILLSGASVEYASPLVISNHSRNLSYTLYLDLPEPGPQESYHLRVGQSPLVSWSAMEDIAPGRVRTTFSMNREIAQQIADALRVPLHDRPPLAPHVDTAFALVEEPDGRLDVSVTVTSRAEQPMGLILEGPYSGGARDNRFEIEVLRDGRQFRPFGPDPVTSYPPERHVTLHPGASMVFSVDARDWASFVLPGAYTLQVAWCLELFELEEYRTTHPEAAFNTCKRRAEFTLKRE